MSSAYHSTSCEVKGSQNSIMNTSASSPPSDQPFLHLLDEIHFQPVFIIGSHRSGTTLLHQILDATGCFNTVTPYLLVRRNQILYNYVNGREAQAKQELDEHFQAVGLNDRVFDKREVAADLAEEYAFVLKDSYWRARISPKTLPCFVEFCKKVQFVSDPTRPLLLKNPWDSLTFMYIKRALPEAKFIFIHRHPLHTINSQLNALRTIVAAKNPYLDALITDKSYSRLFERPLLLNTLRFALSSRSNIGQRMLTRYLRRVTNYYLRNIASLPKEDYVSLKYEDLCAQPESIIRQVLAMLGLEPQHALDYQAFVAPRPLRLLPELDRSHQRVRDQLRPYFAQFGYNG